MSNVVQRVVAEALRYVQAASLESDKHGLEKKKLHETRWSYLYFWRFSRTARIIVLFLRRFSSFYCARQFFSSPRIASCNKICLHSSHNIYQ